VSAEGPGRHFSEPGNSDQRWSWSSRAHRWSTTCHLPNAAYPTTDIKEARTGSEKCPHPSHLGFLGDGFVEAVDDSTLIEFPGNNATRTRQDLRPGYIGPVVESPA